MTRAAAYSQADIARRLRAAKAAGVLTDRTEIEIDRDGKIVLRPAGASPAAGGVNPWDDVLPGQGGPQ